jgi:hypothetical protein
MSDNLQHEEYDDGNMENSEMNGNNDHYDDNGDQNEEYDVSNTE